MVITGLVSPFFKAKFSADWKGRSKVKLVYVKPEVFEAILYYIYTEKIRVRENVILDLLKLVYDCMLTSLIYALLN